MSSMSKVMQKIRADGTEPAEGQAQAEQAQAEQTSPETLAPENAAQATPEDGATERTPIAETPSSFLPDESTAPADFVPAEPAADPAEQPAEQPGVGYGDNTVAWDAKRVDPVIVAFHDRYSAVCEQYRSVRARLLSMNAAQQQQVIAITSSIPEEGKSVSTINLGLVMAEGGEHRILIADADFRRTSIARMLGIPGHRGLADVLRGELDLDQALQPTPFPNLKVLPAGHVRNNAYGELLGGPSTGLVLEQLRAAFDYTFVDTPPITTVSDVGLLAPHCDGAMMVVEMRRTPEPTVQQAVRTLQANNVKILGCLLSRFRDRGAGYYEHYYSSYYRR